MMILRDDDDDVCDVYTRMGQTLMSVKNTMVMKMMLTAGCDGDAMTLHVGEHADDDDE